jgi:hypothetical protein
LCALVFPVITLLPQILPESFHIIHGESSVRV